VSSRGCFPKLVKSFYGGRAWGLEQQNLGLEFFLEEEFFLMGKAIRVSTFSDSPGCEF